MSNTLVTCSILAKEALAVLENMLTFASNVNRDWEDEFTTNQKPAAILPARPSTSRKPPRYVYRAGRVAVPQSTVENTVPLTLSQGGCDLNFTGFERNAVAAADGQQVAGRDRHCCERGGPPGSVQLARFAAFNTIGTPGTLPTTQALALAAVTGVNQRMDEMAAPRDRQRSFIMNPALNGATVTGFAGLFNGQAQLTEQYKKGVMVDSLGLSYAMDQNVDIHTNGTAVVGTNTVNGAGQQGATITVNALNGTVTRGTKITFAGVNAVNPQSRISTGSLMQFVVTADAANAATSLLISPALVNSGAFQNVTASPANAAVITIFGVASGSFNANVAFHKDAYTLAMVPMYAPPSGKGVIDVAQETYKGMSIKVTEFYDGVNDNYIIRFDVLFGWAATYPELGVIFAT
jgi:hypothetical protein